MTITNKTMNKMQKDKNDKIVTLVFGAGVSIGSKLYPIESSLKESFSTMPSAANFFYDLMIQKKNGRSTIPLNLLPFISEGVYKLIRRGWRIGDLNEDYSDPENWKGINIEDVYTFIDIGEKLYTRGTNYYKWFQNSKQMLEMFMTTTLGMRAEKQHCEILMDLFFQLNPNDDILTFNWDTIAENTLHFCGCRQYENYVDMMNSNRINSKNLLKVGTLLKLHGSLNWMQCTNRKCQGYNKIKLSLDQEGLPPRFVGEDLHTCPLCKYNRRKPFIIPPVSNKLIHRNSIVHKLWLIARDKLSVTDKLIIIGYSFPPTDFYSDWLFRQLNFRIKEGPEIVVVNPEILKPQSKVSQRYNALFGKGRYKKYGTLPDLLKSDYKLH